MYVMSKELQKYTTKFPEAVSGILDNDDNPEFSILMVPASRDGDNTGRVHYLDIDLHRLENQKEIDRIRSEYSNSIVVESNEGKKLGMRIVNASDEKPSIVVFSSWSTDSKWKNTEGIVEAIALQNPDYQIVYIDTPGMTNSSRVDRRVMNDMQRTGSYIPMAEQIKSCLDKTDIKVSKIFGISEGAREAIALGSKIGNVDVIAVDGPGTIDQSFIEIAKGFAVVEAERQKRIKKDSSDKEMVKAHGRTPFDGDQRRFFVPGLTRWLFGHNQLFAREKVMKRAGLEGDVRRATEANCKILDYRCGSSAINNVEVSKKLSKRIKDYHVKILPDAPHSIIETNPYAVSALLGAAIDYLESKYSLN